jgi:hypothetical protein
MKYCFKFQVESFELEVSDFKFRVEQANGHISEF